MAARTTNLALLKEQLTQNNNHEALQTNRTEDVQAVCDLMDRMAFEHFPGAPAQKRFKGILVTFEDRLQDLFRNGFPFSKLSEPTCKEALSTSISEDFSMPVLLINMLKSHLLNDGSLSLDDLKQFISTLDLNTILAVLFQTFSEAKNGSHAAQASGCCFLLLLNIVLKKDDFTIPKLQEFRFNMVEDELKATFASLPTKSDPSIQKVLVEMVMKGATSRSSGLMQPFIGKDFKTFEFVANTLATIPFEEWPDKGRLILQSFGRFYSKQIAFTKILQKDDADIRTQTLGLTLERGLLRKRSEDNSSLIGRVAELLPDTSLEGFSLRGIFPNLSTTFYGIVPRLQHYGLHGHSVITFENSVIGRFSSDEGSFLLAYDQRNGDLQWSFAMQGDQIKTDMTPYGIVIMYDKNPEIDMIDPKNGQTRKVLLPVIPKRDNLDQLHITPDGFCYLSTYQDTEQRILGGKIGETWEASFEVSSPQGMFSPMGDFVTFNVGRVLGDPSLMVVDKKGRGFGPFPHMIQMLDHQGQIYAVKKGSKGCTLTISTVDQTNDTTEGVFVEKHRYEMKGTHIRIREILDDGTCVCEEVDRVNKAWSFVDIEKGTQTSIVSLPIYAVTFIDKTKGALWTWDQIGKIVNKYTKEGKEEIGTMDTGTHTRFIHVDPMDRLGFLMNMATY